MVDSLELNGCPLKDLVVSWTFMGKRYTSHNSYWVYVEDWGNPGIYLLKLDYVDESGERGTFMVSNDTCKLDPNFQIEFCPNKNNNTTP